MLSRLRFFLNILNSLNILNALNIFILFNVFILFSAQGAGVVKTAEGADAVLPAVRVSERDCRYLECADGSAYVPNGCNWCWPSFEWNSSDPEKTLATFERQIAKFSSFGGNFIRIWASCDFFENEVSEGKYDETRARRLDRAMGICRKHGVRVKLCLMHATRLSGNTPAHGVAGKHYERRFYDKRNGGSFTDVHDFMASEQGKKLYLQRLDFFAKRYAKENALLAVELWNEMDCCCGAGKFTQDWTEQMLEQAKRRFPDKIVVQSFGSFSDPPQIPNWTAFWRLKGNEIAQIHRYNLPTESLPGAYGSQDVSVASAVEYVRDVVKPNRPILLAETGVAKANWECISPLHGIDREGVILHDTLFAPFFAGACGPGHIWYWDTYIEKLDLWYHFGRFAEAIRGFDPIAENPQTLRNDTEELRVWTLSGKRTLLAYCRDKSTDIYSELGKGIPAPVRKGLELALPTGKATEALIYEPFADRWTRAAVKGGRLMLPPFKRAAVVKVKMAKEAEN